MKTQDPIDTKQFGIIPSMDDFSHNHRYSPSLHIWRVWDSDHTSANNQGIVMKTQEEQYHLVIPCIYHKILPVPFSNTAQVPVLFLVQKVDDREDVFGLFDTKKGKVLTLQIAGKSGIKINDIRSCSHVDGPANASVFLLNKQFIFDQAGPEVAVLLPGLVENATTFLDREELRVLALCDCNMLTPVACVTDVRPGSFKIVLTPSS